MLVLRIFPGFSINHYKLSSVSSYFEIHFIAIVNIWPINCSGFSVAAQEIQYVFVIRQLNVVSQESVV
jgi:hypothetical protein